MPRKSSRTPRSPSQRGRFSVKRKTKAVVRLLKGEDLDTLSRELGVRASTLSNWRDLFLSSGQSGLKTRPADHRDEEIRRLQAKVGELTMDNELLLERCRRQEDGRPLALRRRRS